ncbi:hypothetical protein OY671_008431, partial [Metschnikowia pulcherrima]
PGGAALIVEAQTDNRNRTASDVRSAFTKSGGSLAETGAVAFMFDRVGVIAFAASVADADTMSEAAIEAGAGVGGMLAMSRAEILASGFASIDYADSRDAATSEDVAASTGRPARSSVAARIGKARSIDNMPVGQSAGASG